MARDGLLRGVGLCALACVGAPSAFAQSFNVDFNVGGTGVWGGAPLSGWSAAAGQPGLWNEVDAAFKDDKASLISLDDDADPVTLRWINRPGSVQTASVSAINQGNYARLMNDGVAFAGPGLTYTFEFEGLKLGRYQVFTYAGNILDETVSLVIVTGSEDGVARQIASPPTPGRLVEGMSHAVHDVHSWNGTVRVQVIALTPGVEVFGFQLRYVPAPGALVAVPGLGFVLLARRSRGHCVGGLTR